MNLPAKFQFKSADLIFTAKEEFGGYMVSLEDERPTFHPIKRIRKFIQEGRWVIVTPIPIKPITTSEPQDKYKRIGESIGKLVDEKNKAYGDSFNKCSEFLKILYPNGVSVEHYSDMLGIVRVFDKLMRIATAKDALGENPWKDVGGYAILKSESEE